jgi:hypothetical protein
MYMFIILLKSVEYIENFAGTAKPVSYRSSYYICQLIDPMDPPTPYVIIVCTPAYSTRPAGSETLCKKTVRENVDDDILKAVRRDVTRAKNRLEQFVLTNYITASLYFLILKRHLHERIKKTVSAP